MYSGLHVKYRLFLSISFKNEFSRRTYKEHFNTNFHEKPWTGCRVVACGRTDIHGEAKTDRPVKQITNHYIMKKVTNKLLITRLNN